MRELVDLSEGVGDGGTLPSAMTGSEDDVTCWTSAVEVLGRASIVADSGATTFFFDAPQPILSKTKDAAAVNKQK